MTETLVNGQRLNLSKYLNELKQFRIEVNYELNENYSLYGVELKIAALGLNLDNKFPHPLYFIDKKNFRSPCSGITFSKSLTDSNKTSFLLDFEKLNTDISNIIFTFSIENASTDSQYINYLIFKNFDVILSDVIKNILISFPVPLRFSFERTFEIFALHNLNFEWKAVAQYYSYIGGLNLLTEKYGLEIQLENDSSSFREKAKPFVELKEPLAKKLNYYKQKLLDLSRRNPLINAKSLLEFTEPNFESFFNALVENNKTLTILPKPEEDYYQKNDNEVLTNKTQKELTNFLYRIRHRSLSSIEEQGINILYVSLGLLKWSEIDKAKESLSSPLILVPVEIEKKALNSPYKLKIIDDEIIENPALRFKILQQFGIDLPDIPEDLNSITIKDYFSLLQDKLKVIPEALVEAKCGLGIFSFNKLVLYKDLENYQHLIQDHPLLNGESVDKPLNLPISEYQAEALDK